MKSLKKTAALLLAAALALSLAACGAAARPVGVWKYEMEVGRFFHTTAEQLADELDKNGNGAVYTQKQIETLAEKLNGVFEGVTVTLVMDLREDETWELFYDEAACDAAEAKVREGYRGFVVAVLAILAQVEEDELDDYLKGQGLDPDETVDSLMEQYIRDGQLSALRQIHPQGSYRYEDGRLELFADGADDDEPQEILLIQFDDRELTVTEQENAENGALPEMFLPMRFTK